MEKGINSKKILYPIYVVLLAAFEFIWCIVNIDNLSRHGRMLYPREVTINTLWQLEAVHFIILLPTLLIIIASIIIYKKSFFKEFGFNMGRGNTKYLTYALIIVYTILLIVSVIFGKANRIYALDQWVYFIFVAALAQDILFRGIMPKILSKSGHPEWLSWVLPGILFGITYTVIHAFENGHYHGINSEIIINIGFNIGCHFLFYWLHKRSHSIWQPVFAHALLDYILIMI